ncbi:MAG TPA: HAD hydrolase family protein [Verrucomicrobiae bacterium]|jgi:hydroxymethylpyrimidine pyrophosphatase-like HAD family hydrolase
MPVEKGELEKLRRFLDTHDLMLGCLALDLDGTALTEHQGRIFISPTVEHGVRAVHELKRPIVLNTLRFPLSVIRTIGNAWYDLVDIPVPTVLLNGSILGHIHPVGERLEYEEIAAYPMTAHEIKLVLDGVTELLGKGIDEILLFSYARDWRLGEALWTPKPERVETLKQKFVSASKVISCPLDQLSEELHSKDMCMMSLFIDRPEDTLMAYQHGKRNSFFTRKGVDKAYGLKEIAKHFKVSLDHSVGAGDTEMDSFLAEVGLAVIVGGTPLRFRGKSDTLRVGNPSDLGELLTAMAESTRKPIAS